MTTNLVSRRAALTAPLLTVLGLAACGEEAPPPVFAPLRWNYLPPLKLNVARIDIDDSWTPRGGAREKGFLAPTPPVDALRRMAEDRLIAGGNAGRALFVIDDASIRQSRDDYQGSFAVHLDISTADGSRSGYAEARVTRQRAIQDDSPNGMRAELYDMVRQMMSDMNVEFEFRVQQSLRDDLQTTAPAAPPPGPVDQENLTPPSPELPLPPAEPTAPPRPSAVPFYRPAPTQLGR